MIVALRWGLLPAVATIVFITASCAPLVGRDRPVATSVPASPQLVGSPVSLPQVPLDRGDAARGEAIFSRVGCVGCHSVRGFGGVVAPDLTAVGERAASRATAAGLSRGELYLLQSILEPRAYVVDGFMPLMGDWTGYGLNEQDIADLVAFLRTLTG